MSIDPDISTADAKRLLTVREHLSPLELDRRRFLQMVGWGVGAGALGGGLGEVFAPGLMSNRMREAYAATPIGATDGIVVLVGFDGGVDGLNMVVPYTNGQYYAQHGTIAIPANQVLTLNGSVGLHPSLPYLKTLYDRGEVAVVQGVGYEDPDLSHFSSMALWMYGKNDGLMPSTGWVGRWLDGMAGDDLFRAATVGYSLPLSMVGDVKRGTAIPPWGIGFGGGSEDHDLQLYDAMREFSASPSGRGEWHDTVATTVRGVIDVGQEVSPGLRPRPAGQQPGAADDGGRPPDQRRPRPARHRHRPRRLRHPLQPAAGVRRSDGRIRRRAEGVLHHAR